MPISLITIGIGHFIMYSLSQIHRVIQTQKRLTGKSNKSILTKRGPLSKDSSPERASSVRRGDDDLDEAATLKGGFK